MGGESDTAAVLLVIIPSSLPPSLPYLSPEDGGEVVVLEEHSQFPLLHHAAQLTQPTVGQLAGR